MGDFAESSLIDKEKEHRLSDSRPLANSRAPVSGHTTR